MYILVEAIAICFRVSEIIDGNLIFSFLFKSHTHPPQNAKLIYTAWNWFILLKTDLHRLMYISCESIIWNIKEYTSLCRAFSTKHEKDKIFAASRGSVRTRRSNSEPWPRHHVAITMPRSLYGTFLSSRARTPSHNVPPEIYASTHTTSPCEHTCVHIYTWRQPSLLPKFGWPCLYPPRCTDRHSYSSSPVSQFFPLFS